MVVRPPPPPGDGRATVTWQSRMASTEGTMCDAKDGEASRSTAVWGGGYYGQRWMSAVLKKHINYDKKLFGKTSINLIQTNSVWRSRGFYWPR